MRTIFVKTLAVTGLLLALSGCMMFPLGPDLAKSPSPFGDAPRISLADPAKDDGAADIIHTAAGDTTVVQLSDPAGPASRQTFNADVTWYPFDGGDPAHDYWLIGLNVFKTADRSAYVLLRYPHGLKIARPMDSQAFEMLPLTCDMRGADPFAKMAEPDAVAADIVPDETPAPEISPDPPAPPPACDFKDMDEVKAFLPDILARAKAQPAAPSGDQAFAEPDSSQWGDYHWEPLRVRIP